jgi:hypothetical protein
VKIIPFLQGDERRRKGSLGSRWARDRVANELSKSWRRRAAAVQGERARLGRWMMTELEGREGARTVFCGVGEVAQAGLPTPRRHGTRLKRDYWSLEYSDLAAMRMGIVGSASFHSARKSL